MLHLSLILALAPQSDSKEPSLTTVQVRRAGEVAGIELSDAEIELMLPGVAEHLEGYRKLWELEIENGLASALGFTPLLSGIRPHVETLEPLPRELPEAERPADLEELCYADIATLASLVRSREVSCAELVDVHLARLKRLDPVLQCAITITEERARAQAKALDLELAEGRWRGPLHGIPWGAKDLFAAKGYRTTWGAKPFEDQVIDIDASVVRKLDEAGAVLIAKLTVGALAWGDVWFGGTTKNPWRPEQGSSGSSAGPSAATAAGCVAFAIGTETLGSIVSPSARCGNSSLRPTFGRVSRHGCMALSWSMDKVGPICRSAADLAIVFAAIQGADPLDDATIERPHADLGPIPVEGLRIGYVDGSWRDGDHQKAVLEVLASLGAELVAVTPPELPAGELLTILSAEAATAFDELTRSGRDDLLVRQVEQAWPNVFRTARLIPAVEYLRANRLRRRLMEETAAFMAGFDVLVHPSHEMLGTFNLTGHPTVIVPAGFRENGTPFPVGFTGQLFGEGRLLAVAEAWQRATEFHLKHPEL